MISAIRRGARQWRNALHVDVAWADGLKLSSNPGVRQSPASNMTALVKTREIGVDHSERGDLHAGSRGATGSPFRHGTGRPGGRRR